MLRYLLVFVWVSLAAPLYTLYTIILITYKIQHNEIFDTKSNIKAFSKDFCGQEQKRRLKRVNISAERQY